MAKSNFWGTVGIIAASVLLTLGILRGCSPEEENQDPSNDSVSTEVFTQGIQMKLLQTTENDDGSITKTFTYTITPAEATYQDVSVSAAYIDSSDCSAVLTTSVDNSAKTIDVNCLAAFDKQINVVVQSVDNPDAKATVKVDYVKKILGFQAQGGGGIISFNDSTEYYYPSILKPQYSVYTIDKDYTFSMKNVVVSSLTKNNPGNISFTSCSANFQTELKELLSKWLNREISKPTQADLWALTENNTDKLFVRSSDRWSLRTSSAEYYCVEEPSVKYTGNLTIDITNNYDWSDYTIPVESVSAELGNIQF